jgi:hypothetical protein
MYMEDYKRNENILEELRAEFALTKLLDFKGEINFPC